MTASSSVIADHVPAASATARGAAVKPISTTSVGVEIRPLSALADTIGPWAALAARALEPNVFLDPAFALAAAPALGADVRVGLVWSHNSPQELLGLFPVRVESRRYGLPLPVLCGWTHPYAPLGTPLLHRDAAELALSAWLDRLLCDATLPALLLMTYVRADAPFAAVLDAALERRGCAAADFDRHRRALLAPEPRRADYLRHAIARKQRKELDRKWRRMQELGPVTILHADGAIGVTAALDDFFRLESGGWKGRAGTAADQIAGIRQFMSRAADSLAAEKRVEVYRLCVADRAIAACIVLRSGRSAWCWKIAYDEAFARFSPGAQLLVRVTDDLVHDTGIAEVDSLATPDHPLIDHIWRERCTISDRLIAVKPDASVPFTLARRLEAMRRASRSAARSLREHLRGSRHA
jgi:CelD/BcsL family acetyltransferase involved in cellulose biosynthesis